MTRKPADLSGRYPFKLVFVRRDILNLGGGGFMDPKTDFLRHTNFETVPRVAKRRIVARYQRSNGNVGIVSHNNTNTPFSCPPRQSLILLQRGGWTKANQSIRVD